MSKRTRQERSEALDHLPYHHGPKTCPACGELLTLTVSGQYRHSEGTLARYNEWQCENCGYFHTQFLPPDVAPADFPDDHPF